MSHLVDRRTSGHEPCLIANKIELSHDCCPIKRSIEVVSVAAGNAFVEQNFAFRFAQVAVQIGAPEIVSGRIENDADVVER